MKKFHLSRNNVMLGGVCGGLGEYFNIDPVLFRILFIFFALTGSLGVWVYLLLWLLADSDKKASGPHRRRKDTSPVEDVDFTYVEEDDRKETSEPSN